MSGGRSPRTQAQRDADVFDCELYRLILRAERFAEASKDNKWRGVRTRLIQARLLVRDFMHPDDRKGTEG